MIRSIATLARPALAVVAALALAAPARAQTPAEIVRVLPDVLDFGDVRPGGSATQTVRLQNTSHRNLEIFRVRTTCECTEAEPSSHALPARGYVELTAVFEASHELGPREQSLIVYFAGERSPLRVPVRAHVNQGVRFEIAGATGGAPRTITLTAADAEPFRVLAIDGAGAPDAPAGPRHTLPEPPLSPLASPSDRFVVIETDHPSAPVVAVRRRPLGAERPARPWTIDRDVVTLGAIRPGERRVLHLGLAGLGRETLTTLEDVRVDAVGAEAGVIGIGAAPNGLLVRLRIGVADDASGLVRAAVRFTAEGHSETVELFARVPDAPTGGDPDSQ
jgi:hypothetical protein